MHGVQDGVIANGYGAEALLTLSFKGLLLPGLIPKTYYQNLHCCWQTSLQIIFNPMSCRSAVSGKWQSCCRGATRRRAAGPATAGGRRLVVTR